MAKGRKRTSDPVTVTLISDATGALGTHVLQAVFTQFPQGAFTLHTINFVDSEERLTACLERLKQTTGIIVHATVYDHFKRRIAACCRKQGLPVHDLTGPIVSFLASASGRRPEISHHKLHPLNPEYFNRVEAIGYAIGHDDGAGLKTLHQADVILTGVSRTTKTPTSMVLAMHGYRAANIPLVPAIEPPRELLQADPKRVVCFMLDPKQLANFRLVRVHQQLGFDGGYTDQEAIRQELRWTHALSQSHGWRTLDVTGRAVEETAARVMRMVSKRAS